MTPPDNPKDWLHGITPKAWVAHAVSEIPILLLDHAHCERKAAHTALLLIKRHPTQQTWLKGLSKIAREELRHFELVLELLKKRNIDYRISKAGGYMKHLAKGHDQRNHHERLVHELLVSAIVEARSCERFAALSPALQATDPILASFYDKLYLAEKRHFQIYLQWAIAYDQNYCDAHLDALLAHENKWIQQNDPVFCFHSGVPSKL